MRMRTSAERQKRGRIKNTFVERSSQYTSFSSRQQAANAGSKPKQLTPRVG